MYYRLHTFLFRFRELGHIKACDVNFFPSYASIFLESLKPDQFHDGARDCVWSQGISYTRAHELVKDAFNNNNNNNKIILYSAVSIIMHKALKIQSKK